MRVTRLDAGSMTTPAGLWRADEEDPERRVRYPIPAYLIETDERLILVDAGVAPGATSDFAAYYPDHPRPRLFELELAVALGEQVDLAAVTDVVMTHLHFDHAGGLAQLPGHAPIVIQRREWAAARDDEAIARNFFQPRDYADVADRVVLVDGDHDLLGDGSIELLLTPGHTPGHQSLRVGDDLVIGGDVAFYASALDVLRMPVFADDPDAQAASAARLRALRDGGATVTPGHDPAVVAPGPVP